MVDLFDNSEVMIKYAELMNKRAIDVSDIGGAALGGGAWIAGEQVAKKAIPAILTGIASAGGLVAVLADPIAWGILGSAALVGGIYAAYKEYHYDDSVDEVISNLKTLDPNNKIKNIISSWIAKFETFREALVLPVTGTDENENAKLWSSYTQNLEKLKTFIDSIIEQWPQILPNLTDIGTDPDDTIKAIMKLQRDIISGEQNAKKNVSQVAVKKYREFGQKTKSNYDDIAKSLVSTLEELKKYPDVKIDLDASDEKALKLAQDILSGEIDNEEFKTYHANMVQLNKELNNYLTQYTKTHKVSSSKLLSKRALNVTWNGQQTQKSVENQVHKNISVKNDNVSELQDALNDIGVIFNRVIDNKIPRLAVDGRWGQNTANALSAFINSYESISNRFSQYGISSDTIKEPGFVNDRHLLVAKNITVNFLNNLQNKLSKENEESAQETGAGNTKPGIQQGNSNINSGPCNPDNPRPDSADILACLKGLPTKDPSSGEYVNLYETAIRNGLTDDKMVNIVNDKFNGLAPRQWDKELLLKIFRGNGRWSLY